MAERTGKNWLAFPSLRGGSVSWRADVVAGLTLAAVAAPEQMATARLGSFPPHIGFYVFIAGSLAFALFGANRFLSAGANSTITPIFAASLLAIAPAGGPEYFALTALLSLMVGLILAGAGLFRAGWVANLFSIPVLTGFLGGIAVHIVLSQAPSFFGIADGSGSFLQRVERNQTPCRTDGSLLPCRDCRRRTSQPTPARPAPRAGGRDGRGHGLRS